jgi:hypothetical protein
VSSIDSPGQAEQRPPGALACRFYTCLGWTRPRHAIRLGALVDRTRSPSSPTGVLTIPAGAVALCVSSVRGPRGAAACWLAPTGGIAIRMAGAIAVPQRRRSCLSQRTDPWVSLGDTAGKTSGSAQRGGEGGFGRGAGGGAGPSANRPTRRGEQAPERLDMLLRAVTLASSLRFRRTVRGITSLVIGLDSDEPGSVCSDHCLRLVSNAKLRHNVSKMCFYGSFADV